MRSDLLSSSVPLRSRTSGSPSCATASKPTTLREFPDSAPETSRGPITLRASAKQLRASGCSSADRRQLEGSAVRQYHPFCRCPPRLPPAGDGGRRQSADGVLHERPEERRKISTPVYAREWLEFSPARHSSFVPKKTPRRFSRCTASHHGYRTRFAIVFFPLEQHSGR